MVASSLAVEVGFVLGLLPLDSSPSPGPATVEPAQSSNGPKKPSTDRSTRKAGRQTSIIRNPASTPSSKNSTGQLQHCGTAPISPARLWALAPAGVGVNLGAVGRSQSTGRPGPTSKGPDVDLP